MQGPTSSLPTVTDILKRIADDKALTLFNNIALTNGDDTIHTLIDNHQIKDILLPEWFDETSDRSVIPIPQT